MATFLERHPISMRVAAVVAAFLVADLALSAGASLVEWVKRGRERKYRIESAIYHHDLRPRAGPIRAYWGPHAYSVLTNSLGFRDEDTRDVPLRSPRTRLLLIGDSFTEGVG